MMHSFSSEAEDIDSANSISDDSSEDSVSVRSDDNEEALQLAIQEGQHSVLEFAIEGDETRIIAAGCSGQGFDKGARMSVAQDINKKTDDGIPTQLFHLGDFIYPRGVSANLQDADKSIVTHLVDPYSDIYSKNNVDMFVLIGNHESDNQGKKYVSPERSAKKKYDLLTAVHRVDHESLYMPGTYYAAVIKNTKGDILYGTICADGNSLADDPAQLAWLKDAVIKFKDIPVKFIKLHQSIGRTAGKRELSGDDGKYGATKAEYEASQHTRIQLALERERINLNSFIEVAAHEHTHLTRMNSSKNNLPFLTVVEGRMGSHSNRKFATLSEGTIFADATHFGYTEFLVNKNGNVTAYVWGVDNKKESVLQLHLDISPYSQEVNVLVNSGIDKKLLKKHKASIEFFTLAQRNNSAFLSFSIARYLWTQHYESLLALKDNFDSNHQGKDVIEGLMLLTIANQAGAISTQAYADIIHCYLNLMSRPVWHANTEGGKFLNKKIYQDLYKDLQAFHYCLTTLDESNNNFSEENSGEQNKLIKKSLQSGFIKGEETDEQALKSFIESFMRNTILLRGMIVEACKSYAEYLYHSMYSKVDGKEFKAEFFYFIAQSNPIVARLFAVEFLNEKMSPIDLIKEIMLSDSSPNANLSGKVFLYLGSAFITMLRSRVSEEGSHALNILKCWNSKYGDQLDDFAQLDRLTLRAQLFLIDYFSNIQEKTGVFQQFFAEKSLCACFAEDSLWQPALRERFVTEELTQRYEAWKKEPAPTYFQSWINYFTGSADTKSKSAVTINPLRL